MDGRLSTEDMVSVNLSWWGSLKHVVVYDVFNLLGLAWVVDVGKEAHSFF